MNDQVVSVLLPGGRKSLGHFFEVILHQNYWSHQFIFFLKKVVQFLSFKMYPFLSKLDKAVLNGRHIYELGEKVFPRF